VGTRDRLHSHQRRTQRGAVAAREDGHRPYRPRRPVVAGLVAPDTGRSYGAYGKKALAEWPDRRLDQVTASEIKAMTEKAKATAPGRSNSRGGCTAAENFQPRWLSHAVPGSSASRNEDTQRK
jgi:hypothetical protein